MKDDEYFAQEPPGGRPHAGEATDGAEDAVPADASRRPAAEPLDEPSAEPWTEPTAVLPAGDDRAGGADAGATPAARPGRRWQRNPWVWVALLALLLALVVGSVQWSRANAAQARRDAVTATVTGYYGALTSGDAARALEYGSDGARPGGLLTDAVLDASQQAAPIADVRVTDVQLNAAGDQAVASTNYRIGAKPVSTQLGLRADGSGAWKLLDTTGELAATPASTVVNGQAVSRQVNPAFPGTYSASAPNDRITVSDAQATVTDPGAATARLAPAVTLSDRGRQAVRTAGQAALKACFDTRSSSPKGCPWTIQGRVQEGTVQYRVTKDPWAAYQPRLDGEALTASGPVKLDLAVSAKMTVDGRPAVASQTLSFSAPLTVDLKPATPTARWANS